jgi:Asp-tRNA(Asn)/Glu-tRNA(Gln) amidotransferase B subunit
MLAKTIDCLKDKKIHEARAFNFTYRYIDDVLSINNSRFAEGKMRIDVTNTFVDYL